VEYDHIAAHLIDIAVFVLPTSVEDETTPANTAATELQMSDGASDVFRPPKRIEGLGWFEKFGEESIAPFDIIRTLRMDGFTVTRAAVCKVGPQSGQLYALQTWRRTTKARQKDLERMAREVEVLRRLSHVHVVSIVGCYLTSREANVILRPLCNMSLSDVLNDRQQGASQSPVLTKWFGCLAVGLDYLHSNLVRHGDIKPGSILVWNGHVCYSGFEVVRDLRERDAAWESAAENSDEYLVYTRRYAAAEIRDDRRVRGRSSDIFSLGCVFLEMLNVLGGRQPDDAYGAINSTLYAHDMYHLPTWLDALEVPTHVPGIKELCLHMMQKAPEDRPTAAELVRTITRLDAEMPKYSPPLVGRCIHGGKEAVQSRTEDPRESLSLVDERIHIGRAEEEVHWMDED
jgi:serine/threonine protein kinase